MPVIEVIADPFYSTSREIHAVRDGACLSEFLEEHVPSYDPELNLLTAELNGRSLIDFSVPLAEGDRLCIYVRPQEPISTAILVISVISLAYSIYQYFTLSEPKSTQLGESSPIYDANVQANRPRLRSPIPEVFGRHLLFPDIASAPWREYIDNAQWIHLLLCVGVGDYTIESNEIYIGNTPINRYGSDVDLEIFGPGQDVTGHEASRNVFSSGEVGPTVGTSGIELFGANEALGQIGFMGVLWDFEGDMATFSFTATPDGEIPDFDNIEFIELVTETGENDGFYRIDAYDDETQTLTVTKMLPDLSAPDPDWADSASPMLFEPEFGTTAELTVVDDMGGGQYVGPFLACPLNETTEKIMLDFSWPAIFRISRSGKQRPIEIEWDIEYRDVNAGGAYTVLNESIEENTVSAVGRTITINLPSAMTPEVRVRRITESRRIAAVADNMFWVALKSELTRATSYDDVTILAVSVRGTNALAAQSENKFNLVATRHLPELSGGEFGGSIATRQIAAAYGYVIRDIGLTNDDIDLEELQAVQSIWTDRSDTFDGVFDTFDTFFEVLKKILRPGYAVPIIRDALFSLSRDQVRTQFEDMYQPQNMLAGGLEREYTLIDEDEPDGIEVEYFDETTWRPETVLCLLDDDGGNMAEKVQAFGIVDRDRAWRLGMRVRRERRYRRIQYRWTTELDAMNSSFGSFCSLADDMPGYSQVGEVVAMTGGALTLSDPVEFGVGTHFIALRKPDGTLSGPYTATAGADEFTVNIIPSIDFVPIFDGSIERPLYQFGVATRLHEAVLMTEITPEGLESVACTAINYDERVYADDDNFAPV